MAYQRKTPKRQPAVLDMARVNAAVAVITGSAIPKPAAVHMSLRAEDAGRRKILPQLGKRQCIGISYFQSPYDS